MFDPKPSCFAYLGSLQDQYLAVVLSLAVLHLCLAAKAFLSGMLDDKNGITLKTHKDKEGKFGRILGELWRNTDFADQSINEYMIEKYHAVRYFGLSKKDIKEEQLKNRELVNLI